MAKDHNLYPIDFSLGLLEFGKITLNNVLEFDIICMQYVGDFSPSCCVMCVSIQQALVGELDTLI
jgi:hypothetical protein